MSQSFCRHVPQQLYNTIISTDAKKKTACVQKACVNPCLEGSDIWYSLQAEWGDSQICDTHFIARLYNPDNT